VRTGGEPKKIACEYGDLKWEDNTTHQHRTHYSVSLKTAGLSKFEVYHDGKMGSTEWYGLFCIAPLCNVSPVKLGTFNCAKIDHTFPQRSCGVDILTEVKLILHTEKPPLTWESSGKIFDQFMKN
jgi:hypothetical protein